MNYLNEDKIEDFCQYHTVVVHGRVFHADDVFVVAYINLMRKEMNLIPLSVKRVFSVPEDYTEENGFLVADIGNGRFDHHFSNENKSYREYTDADGNALPYAAFGLVAKEYHFLLEEKEYEALDSWIAPLDRHDNTGCGHAIAEVISSFNSNWDEEPGQQDEKFMEAVEFATKILEKKISRIRANYKLLGTVKEIKDNPDKFMINKTVFLDRYIPIGGYLADTDICFIGSPAMDGNYQILTVKGEDHRTDKIPFPEEIRGTVGGEYNIAFCHHGGFLCSFKSKTDAMRFMADWMMEK